MRKGKRVSVSLETQDYVEAIQKAKNLEDTPEMNPGGLLEAEIERYVVAKIVANRMTLRTQRNTEQMLGRLVKHFGNVNPAALTHARAQAYYDAMKEGGMSETTAQTYIARTRPFFEWLFRECHSIRENPFSRIKMGRLVSAARKEFCEPELRNKLIEECTRPDLKFILYCGFHSGLRRTEISEARPCWFDLSRNLLTIRKLSPTEAAAKGLDPFDLKDREERTIPLSTAFSKWLKEWKTGIKVPDGTVSKWSPEQDYMLAPGVRRNRYIYRYDFRRPFEDYMVKHDCDWVTIHTMRRTFASLAASSGTPLYHIAKWLGDDIQTTQRHYAHLAPDGGLLDKAIG